MAFGVNRKTPHVLLKPVCFEDKIALLQLYLPFSCLGKAFTPIYFSQQRYVSNFHFNSYQQTSSNLKLNIENILKNQSAGGYPKSVMLTG